MNDAVCFYITKRIDKLKENVIQCDFFKWCNIVANEFTNILSVNVLHKNIACMNVLVCIIVINADDISMVQLIENLDFVKKILIKLFLDFIILWLIFLGDKQFVNKRILKQDRFPERPAAQIIVDHNIILLLDKRNNIPVLFGNSHIQPSCFLIPFHHRPRQLRPHPHSHPQIQFKDFDTADINNLSAITLLFIATDIY